MYAVIIEWDGQKPKTTWYNRLGHLGITIQGTKSGVASSKSSVPSERRQFKGTISLEEDFNKYGRETGRRVKWNGSQELYEGTVAQEGLLVVHSREMALYLATLATKFGAREVFITEDIIVKPFTNVWSGFDEIEERLSKRGRREEETVCVLCLDEVKSYFVKTDKPVVQCPSCGSMGITTSFRIPLLVNSSKTGFERWVETRFGLGFGFQIPPVNVDATINIDEDITLNDSEKRFSQLVEKWYLKYENRMSAFPQEKIEEILDAMYVSRAYIDEQRRAESRGKTFVEFAMANVPMSISESSIELDWNDFAVTHGAYAAMMLRNTLAS